MADENENEKGQEQLDLGEALTVTVRAPKKRKSQNEFAEDQLFNRIKELAKLRGFSDIITKARVYRETLSGGRFTCPSYNAFMEDDDVGKIYGPGEYLVSYESEDESGEKVYKPVRYRIGKEFAQVHRAYCEEAGIPCLLRDDTKIPGQEHMAPKPGFFDNLSPEKVALFTAILGALKGMMGGSNGDLRTVIEGQAKIISSFSGNGKQSSPSAGLLEMLAPKLIERAFDTSKPEDPMKSILASLGAVKEIKTLFGDSEEKGENNGMMQTLIEKAMDVLPVLIAQHGSAKDAGKDLKQNKLVQAFVNNPDAQKAFYQSAVSRVGASAANDLAAGLGIDTARLQPSQAEPIIITQSNNGRIQF
jgi:hypothetical protein